jgi:ABC-type transport system involved in multi-copper enzyme maturation permease subunit
MAYEASASRDHWRRTLAIAHYTLLEAWRNRLLLILLAVVVTLVLASLFVQELAITESQRIRTGFLAATLRVAAAFTISFYVLQGLLREFHDKVVELVLSIDLPRASYVLGKFLAYALLGAAATIVVSLPLALLAPWQDVVAWAFTLMLELWLLAAFAVFCMTTFTQLLPAATFVLAFYLLARSISAIQLISSSTLLGSGFGPQAAAFVADALALILPRLDAYAQTAWLVDAQALPISFAFALLQTAVYTMLLLAAAMFDLYRRNF